jgi:P27 family predicted phage terminase small subunit
MPDQRGRKSAAEHEVSSLGVVRLTDARIQPPDHLSERELNEWHSIVDSLPADWFRPADISLLAAYCTASAIYKEAREAIEEHGIMIKDESRGRYYANPAQTLLSTQASAMAQLAVKLRLCPSSRYEAKGAGAAGRGAKQTKRPWEATGTDGE